jgi:nucleoid DNA-binding protein
MAVKQSDATRVARRARVSREVLDAVLDAIEYQLKHYGGRVYLPGFGVFEVMTSKSRRIRSPQGEPLVLPALRHVKFRPARALTGFVRGSRPS